MNTEDASLTTVWILSTVGNKSSYKKLSKRKILDVSIPTACNYVRNAFTAIKLKESSNFMLGISMAYRKKTDYFHNETSSLKKNIIHNLVMQRRLGDTSQIASLTALSRTLMRDDSSFDITRGLVPPLILNVSKDAEVNVSNVSEIYQNIKEGQPENRPVCMSDLPQDDLVNHNLTYEFNELDDGLPFGDPYIFSEIGTGNGKEKNVNTHKEKDKDSDSIQETDAKNWEEHAHLDDKPLETRPDFPLDENAEIGVNNTLQPIGVSPKRRRKNIVFDNKIEFSIGQLQSALSNQAHTVSRKDQISIQIQDNVERILISELTESVVNSVVAKSKQWYNSTRENNKKRRSEFEPEIEIGRYTKRSRSNSSSSRNSLINFGNSKSSTPEVGRNFDWLYDRNSNDAELELTFADNDLGSDVFQESFDEAGANAHDSEPNLETDFAQNLLLSDNDPLQQLLFGSETSETVTRAHISFFNKTQRDRKRKSKKQSSRPKENFLDEPLYEVEHETSNVQLSLLDESFDSLNGGTKHFFFYIYNRLGQLMTDSRTDTIQELKIKDVSGRSKSKFLQRINLGNRLVTVRFDAILPESCDKRLASKAFVSILELATKSLLDLKQQSDMIVLYLNV